MFESAAVGVAGEGTKMASYDFRVYPEHGRWHFTILKLMEGPAGPPNRIYESQDVHREGYESEEEAKKKALEYKDLLSEEPP